jgi:hypothetical protein
LGMERVFPRAYLVLLSGDDDSMIATGRK